MRIAQKAIDDIVAHARGEAPNECCGLLIGDRNTVERSVRARNRETGPARYLIDPEDHFAAIHAARMDNKRVIGAYHSHPSSPPSPSASDVSEASGGADFLYVIVSLKQSEEELFAYRLKRGSVIPVELVPAT